LLSELDRTKCGSNGSNAGRRQCAAPSPPAPPESFDVWRKGKASGDSADKISLAELSAPALPVLDSHPAIRDHASGEDVAFEPSKERHRIALLLEPARLPDDWSERKRAKSTWLPEHYMAPETLSRKSLRTPFERHERLPVFYDLVAVAVLTNFSQGNSHLEASSIASFLSFFVLFWVMWLSQALYDVRFASNDLVHRLMKLCVSSRFA
jgi:hypothetical protein